MPVKTINHILSRCGGGKSRHTISALVKQQSIELTDRIYIFASKTNRLSKQNYKHYADEVIKSELSLIFKIVDSSTTKNVVQAVEETLRSITSGVVFVSHKALSLLDPKLLSGTTLIFDEIPQELIQPLLVRFEEKDRGQHWERFLCTEESQHKNYLRVSIAPDADKNELRRIIKNVNSNHDNSITRDVTRLLNFVLEGYEVLYQTQTQPKANDTPRTFCVYQALEWKTLKDVVDNADAMIILSAQLEETLFGFIAKNLLHLTISTPSITPSIKLETKHKQRARIYPILDANSWSSTLKSSPASEQLIDPNNLIDPRDTVAMHAQRIINKRFGSMNYLLIPNEKDPIIEELQQDNVTKITSAVHGVNDYRHIMHSAFIASNRPNPFEEKTHMMFASDHNLDPTKLRNALITERCHEAAYQSIARTAIRNYTLSSEYEHLIFVPDMEYAEYIANWFDKGCATIDKSLSCTLISAQERKLDDVKKLDMVKRILADKGKPGVTMTDLFAREGISKASFDRYKRKFRSILTQSGLLQASP